MIPDGYVPPLRNTEDIPIQRNSVGAMGLSGPTDTFKAYVYRGTGEDVRPDWDLSLLEARPRKKPKHDPAKVRAANIKRAKRYKPSPKRKPFKLDTPWRTGPRPVVDTPLPEPALKPIRPAQGWAPTTGAEIDDLLSELEDHEDTDRGSFPETAWRDQALLLGLFQSDGGEYL